VVDTFTVEQFRRRHHHHHFIQLYNRKILLQVVHTGPERRDHSLWVSDPVDPN